MQLPAARATVELAKTYSRKPEELLLLGFCSTRRALRDFSDRRQGVADLLLDLRGDLAVRHHVENGLHRLALDELDHGALEDLRVDGVHRVGKGNADGSTPEYSFHWNGTSDKIFLFEAPIDMLSYISMNPHNWQQNTYAASCSVADRVLFQCLKDNPNIREVYLCLDNDEAGQKAAKRISDKLFVMGYKSEILTPTYKDWNEDLTTSQKEGEPQWTTQLS